VSLGVVGGSKEKETLRGEERLQESSKVLALVSSLRGYSASMKMWVWRIQTSIGVLRVVKSRQCCCA